MPTETLPKQNALSRLPYWPYAWLFAVLVVLAQLVLLSQGMEIPLPYATQFAAVIGSAVLGGMWSGSIAGFLCGILQFYTYQVGLGPVSLIGNQLHLFVGIVITLGLGWYLGLLRDQFLNLVIELDKSRRQLADANAGLAQRYDKRSRELELVKDRLLVSQNRLRNVTKRWVEAQESERRNLARDLHDDIGQCLTALRINLESNKGLFENNEEAARFIRTSYELVDEVISSVRQLSLNLRPSLLDDLGLVAALRDLAMKQLGLKDISCKLEVQGSDHFIDPAHSIAAYRIAQEIVTNILKHSSATEVLINIRIDPSTLHIQFQDNGVGFEASEENLDSRHIGLASMRERASLVGGDVRVQSGHGKGTSVRLNMPLRLDETSESGAAA